MVTKQKVVSILVPVYGVEEYVEACVRSLMEQSYAECRYFFVDDASKDRSVEVIRRTVSEYPHREEFVKIISHAQNLGVGESRNTLLDNAEGDYIVWVDSDDWVDERFVEALVTRATIQAAETIRCGRVIVEHNGEQKVDNICWLESPKQSLRAVIGQSHMVTNNLHGVMTRRSLIEKHNIRFAPNINMGEDYTFIAQLLYHSTKIANLNMPLYYYRAVRTGSYMSLIQTKDIESYVRGNIWVSTFIENQSRAKEFEKALALGKVNIKKWIAYRGKNAAEYDNQIFHPSRDKWLKSWSIRLYNRVVDMGNIALIRIVAAIVNAPIWFRVQKTKTSMKKSIRQQNLWGN